MFPTNKPHVSYSEVRTWKECPYRHKLSYIEKIDLSEDSPYLHYGTIIHDALENYLSSKQFNFADVEKKLRKAWEEGGFDSEDYIQAQAAHRKNMGWKPKSHNYIDEWVEWAQSVINEIPEFLDNTFPNWKMVSAEEQLYEPIPGYDIKFKGFIDGLIECDGPGNRRVYWVIDWKTAGAGGWFWTKKKDFNTLAQVALYKSFWREKNSLGSRDVKCGFVLLKRGAKPGKVCELLTVSAGPKIEEKARKMVRNMISTVKRGFFFKNRDSCKFCEYHNTEHCT